MPEFKCNEKPQQQYNSGYCQEGNSIIASLVACFQPKRAGCSFLRCEIIRHIIPRLTARRI